VTWKFGVSSRIIFVLSEVAVSRSILMRYRAYSIRHRLLLLCRHMWNPCLINTILSCDDLKHNDILLSYKQENMENSCIYRLLLLFKLCMRRVCVGLWKGDGESHGVHVCKHALHDTHNVCLCMTMGCVNVHEDIYFVTHDIRIATHLKFSTPRRVNPERYEVFLF